ncbi:MAG TPA: peptidoglycan-binding domain-containing protein [Planctomycetota bacterium]|nr:peptidoglycan-binding domain-containing protein [Planctomycetota bacterium]
MGRVPGFLVLGMTAVVLLVLGMAAVAFADSGPSDYAQLDSCRQGTSLRAGASGPEVTALQNALAGVSCTVPLTGKFDDATVAAVESFQTSRSLPADGVVGAKTMQAFDAALGIGKQASPGLARIAQGQVTREITAEAVAILKAHRTDDIGTEIPFTANGKNYVGRIELHFHPFNGPIKPWGYHHGVSVYSVNGPAPAKASGKNAVKGLAARPSGAPTGSQFLVDTAKLSRADRETEILKQISSGNVPSFLRHYVDVTVSSGGHTLVLHVLPDYVAIGSDEDFVRIPMAAPTAQKVADLCSASLPTRKIVDLIWQEAAVKTAPIPMTPNAQMMSNDYYLTHQKKVEEALAGKRRGELVAGQKKDIVITNQLAKHPDKVAIYGWHKLDGKPIQPLSTVHEASYADYSHGLRLIDQEVVLDGKTVRLDQILADAKLSALLSDEGPIASPRIP